MIEKLELHHLRVLSAITAHGTVSAAAASLDVSQQAVSLQLKRIRDILGDPVFQRSGHRMVPTAYGRSIEPYVHQVLALLHAMPLPTTPSLETIERTLSLSATDYAQRIIVDELLRKLRRAAPRVTVKLSNIEGLSLGRRMQEGEIDLAFTSNGYVPEGLLSTPLFTERYVCVSARPLTDGNEVLSVEALATHDFLVVSPAVPGFDGSAAGWFEQQGLRRRVVASVPSFFMLQTCLQHADLVAFMPSRLMPCEGLSEVPLARYPPGFQVVAAYHASALSDPLVSWVLDQVQNRDGMTS